ncbi:MAG TPA: cyclic nucleotide-binding domain-containing protein [Bacteroidota bacterium]|nr:cyclic nucleotide-binding domain-containing protein [Bacteroidota bacterium]
MNIENLSEILRQHPFLADLPEDHMAIITGCALNAHFTEGSMLIREGEIADKFFLLRSGRVTLEMDMPPRGSLRIQTVGPGEVLGWSWLISPYRWHFSARAVADVRAIALDAECLRTKCQKDHDFGYVILDRFVRLMEDRLQATRLQLLDLALLSPEVAR